MALTTVDRLVAFLGKVTPQDTSLLETLLAGASSFFESEIGRTILATEYTDVRDGNGTSSLVLEASPVISVSQVVVDGEAIEARSSWDGEGYAVHGDRVRLVGYRFTPGVLNVEVTYTAGWEVVPEDVQLAVCELAAMKYRQRDSLGVLSRAVVGQEQTMYQTITLPISIQRVIDNYKVPVVG